MTTGRTLRSEIEWQAERRSGSTWLIFEAADGTVTTYTYSGFVEQVYRASTVLAELGIAHGDRVLLHLRNCPEFVVLWFAAACMSVTVVPTNPLSSDPELEYLCGHSGAGAVVVAPSDIDRAERLRVACPGIRHILVCGRAPAGAVSLPEAMAAAPARPPLTAPSPNDEVAILYTSGTTSRPKGCLITNANYIHAAEAVGQHIGTTSADRSLAVLPFFHGNAQYYSTMPTLLAGGTLIVAERFSASRFFSTAVRHSATFTSLFAAPMRMILAQPEEPEPPPHQLRLAIFAQSVTRSQLDEWGRRFRVPLMQIYGMTEQLGHPLANPLHGRRDNMTIGRATLAYTCRIVDDDGTDVEVGETGQLLVSGEPGVSLMKGYFEDAVATRAALRGGWLWTGDNVRRREDGFVEFVDRAKDMIKRAGENVAASEVEGVLKEHPAVFDAAVIGVPDPVRDEAIKAFVVLRLEYTATAEALIAWCAERLAVFRVPQLIEFIEELPRTPVGKIQKHLLRERDVTSS